MTSFSSLVAAAWRLTRSWKQQEQRVKEVTAKLRGNEVFKSITDTAVYPGSVVTVSTEVMQQIPATRPGVVVGVMFDTKTNQFTRLVYQGDQDDPSALRKPV